jgi:CRAL/TRIO domain
MSVAVGVKQRTTAMSTRTPVVLTTRSSPLLEDEERLWLIDLEDELRRHNHNHHNHNNKKERIGPWSEFDLACHLLVAKNQALKAVHRLRRMEKFRQQYHIPQHPTVYEAMKSVETLMHARPEFLHAVGKNSGGQWVVSFQLKGLTDPDCHKGELTVDQEFAGLYFLLMAMQPDLDAVRKGTVWIADLQGITLQNLPMSMVNGARALCRDAYPIKVCDVPCWNTPSRFSAVYALCRPFLSAHLTEKLVWDCTPQLLRQYFPSTLLPRSLGGTQSQNDIMDILGANLMRRFENQQSFQLHPV